MRVVPLTESGAPDMKRRLPKNQLDLVRHPVARALLEALRRVEVRRPRGVSITAAVLLKGPPYLTPNKSLGVNRVVFFALVGRDHADRIGELPLSSADSLHERLGTQGLQQWCLDCIRSGADSARMTARRQLNVLGEILARNGGPVLSRHT